MDAAVSRVTTRTVHLPELATRVPFGYNTRYFRPSKMRETLTEPAGTYVVTVSGPAQTPLGRDHATQTGSRQWAANGKPYEGDPIGEMPAALRPWLAGAAALRDWTAGQ